MEQLPRRISLVTETQAVLLQGLQAARWKKILPAERNLCAQLGVSRWTLRAALAALTKGGHLQVSQGLPSKITTKCQKPSTGPRRPTQIGLLVPRPLWQLGQYDSLWIDELRAILHNRDQALVIVEAKKAYSSLRPDRLMQRLVGKQSCDAWILLQSSTAVQAWFQRQGRAAIVAGTLGKGILLPSVDFDQRQAGVHIGHVLIRAGHRRIAFFTPREPTSGVLACEAGLRSALRNATGGQAVVQLFAADNRVEIRRGVALCLNSADSPTAIVCAKASATLTVLSDLARRQLRVPRDLSVISVETEPFFEHLVPMPTHYARLRELYAKRVARLIEQRLEGSVRKLEKKLELTYVHGESVGPCKELNRRPPVPKMIIP